MSKVKRILGALEQQQQTAWKDNWEIVGKADLQKKSVYKTVVNK